MQTLLGALKKFEQFFILEQFFEAHEYLEKVWINVSGEEKICAQGFIQIAVAMHHLKQNNLVGAGNCFRRAQTKLKKFPHSKIPVQVQAAILIIKKIVKDK